MTELHLVRPSLHEVEEAAAAAEVANEKKSPLIPELTEIQSQQMERLNALADLAMEMRLLTKSDVLDRVNAVRRQPSGVKMSLLKEKEINLDTLAPRYAQAARKVSAELAKQFLSPEIKGLHERRLGSAITSVEEAAALAEKLVKPFREEYETHIPKEAREVGRTRDLNAYNSAAASATFASQNDRHERVWREVVDKLSVLPGPHREALEKYLQERNADAVRELISKPITLPRRSKIEIDSSGTKEEIMRVAELLQSAENLVGAIEPGAENFEMREIVELAALALQEKLNARARELGSSLTFEIAAPEIPENFTKAHFEAMHEFFGGNLEPMVLPKPEELDNLSQSYAAVMYPPKILERQRQDQEKHPSLVSFRPDWFDQKTDEWVDHRPAAERGTWGEAYLRSMKAELKSIGGSALFMETTRKPNYTNGRQHYGKEAGDDASKDPLLPIFREAFGEDANRFNHSWDEVLPLLNKVKERLSATFTAEHLAIPEFDVILVPAAAANLSMTFLHPKNSRMNTWEGTSTVLVDDQNKDTVYRLDVGGAGGGGAAGVGNDLRGRRWGGRGARLAVVLKKPKP